MPKMVLSIFWNLIQRHPETDYGVMVLFKFVAENYTERHSDLYSIDLTHFV